MKTELIQQFQTLLNVSLGEPHVKVDGQFGTKTRAAYKMLSQFQRNSMHSGLQSIVAPVTEYLGPSWVPVSEIRDYVDDASALFALEPDHLMTMLHIEAPAAHMSGEVHYNAHAVSPSGLHRGLFQLGKPAWSDARRFARLKQISSPLTGSAYATSVFDPVRNIYAAAAFIAHHKEYALTKIPSLNFSANIAYAMHNQGAGFIRKAKENSDYINLAGQSPVARSVIERAAEEVRSS